ncbi:MAG: hypothetical protein JNL21_22680 [Myxococcales bacterium]|nr:hypothetical protein [Myxococcales bacterium]
MTRIAIQFHALPSEVIDLIDEFVRVERLSLAVVTFPPFRAEEAQADALPSFLGGRTALRVVMTPEPVDVSASNIRDMLERNGDCLVVDIGQKSAEGLGESVMSTASEDKERLALWRRFAKRVRSMTKAGAIAFDPATGAESRVKNHRYSAGAKAAQEAGVEMLPTAGAARLRFEG